jgi:hypothetical protein
VAEDQLVQVRAESVRGACVLGVAGGGVVECGLVPVGVGRPVADAAQRVLELVRAAERHEVGVAEHDDGSAYAVAALTESRVPADH